MLREKFSRLPNGLEGSERNRRILQALTILVALFISGLALDGSAADLQPPPPGSDAKEIARRAEDSLRSARTTLDASMTVVSPRLSAPRVVRFQSWEERDTKRSMVRILSPAKDAGTGFLKLHPNLWMFVPRVERTIRIPPSMMLQSWMGSDMTNDDLVKESSTLDDYSHTLLGLDPSPESNPELPAYVVEYIPNEDAPVVWGKIVAWIEQEHGTPLQQDFYDEDGSLLRRMQFSDVRAVGERRVPYRWAMTPLDKEGHSTTIEIESIVFDAEIDPSIFTKRNLRKARR
ncbi:MAG: outer membrane lipoprotein-sorting protein [Myxococcota bacterium]|nr:outer membrane lipoprotein-sorting protein [Myxococcota bacterium]